MTEQATLTPEEAILAVASAVCQTCEVPRFPTLQVECDLPCARGHDDHVGNCQGRGWVPVAWTDEREIRLALEAAGFPVRYLDGQWNVSHPGTDRFPRDGCAEIAVAADRAIKAEASDA